MNLILPYEIAHRAVSHDELIGKHTAGSVSGRQQFLSNNALQRVGKLKNDLALSTPFKNTNDSFQGQWHIGWVHGGQHEMSGFGSSEGGRNRLVIAHLAHNNDVRILP